jgi:hypothetical protein
MGFMVFLLVVSIKYNPPPWKFQMANLSLQEHIFQNPFPEFFSCGQTNDRYGGKNFSQEWTTLINPFQYITPFIPPEAVRKSPLFVSPVKTGVQGICNPMKALDSGFLRNDVKPHQD